MGVPAGIDGSLMSMAAPVAHVWLPDAPALLLGDGAASVSPAHVPLTSATCPPPAFTRPAAGGGGLTTVEPPPPEPGTTSMAWMVGFSTTWPKLMLMVPSVRWTGNRLTTPLLALLPARA